MFPKNVPIAITFLLLTVAQQDVAATDLHTNRSVDGRIFGGTVAPKDSFPYLASVWAKWSGTNERRVLCAGAIISSKTILTSARCVFEISPRNLAVATGSLELDYLPKHSVQKKITHKNFERTIRRNDIALLKLYEDLIFSRSVAKIELGTFYVEGGNLGFFSGWGSTKYPLGVVKQLRFTVLKTITNEKCQSYYSNRIGPSQLCAISEKEKATICLDDSGGPLVIRNQVVGIASMGYYCGTEHPDVFTRISSYVDWIKENMS